MATYKEVESALKKIDCTSLDYEGWLNIGMAIKAEGLSCNLWENWSRTDKRYHQGECEKKWNGFNGNGITIATLFEKARKNGWRPEAEVFDFNSVISTEEVYKESTPVEDFKNYLSALFKKDEYVNFVVESIDNGEHHFIPAGKGVSLPLNYLIEKCNRYTDMSFIIGDWNKEAGAWIRINPVDGSGEVADANITSFRHALIESDTLPIEEQARVYKELKLPIAALVESAGKSLHAIVRIDADSKEEYKERVKFLHEFMTKHGIEIDKQNKNAGRLSRLPSVTRNGKLQKLRGTNLGFLSWEEWKSWADVEVWGLPPIKDASIALDPNTIIQLKPEIVCGLLRKEEKMLISGQSKAGKTFLVLELSIAIASGKKWLGFNCIKSKVLHIDFEMTEGSLNRRIKDVCNKMGVFQADIKNFFKYWSLRGKAKEIHQMTPAIIQELKRGKYNFLVIDPIYKIMKGDENSSNDAREFMNELEYIATEAECAIAFVHHQTKGFQNEKEAREKASGSGVWVRDPDVVLPFTELDLSDGEAAVYADGKKTVALRCEPILRDWKHMDDFDVFFTYPLHEIDKEGVLKEVKMKGTKKSITKPQPTIITVDMAFETLSSKGRVLLVDLYNYLCKPEMKVTYEFWRAKGAEGIRNRMKRFNNSLKDLGYSFYKTDSKMCLYDEKGDLNAIEAIAYEVKKE